MAEPFQDHITQLSRELTAAEWALGEQALDADRLARDRGDIPWVDTIDQLTEAENLAFEHEYGPEAIVLDTSTPQMESRVQALLERLDQRLDAAISAGVDDLAHGSDEPQHQREQDQGMGY